MIHTCMVEERNAVKMLDGEEVVAIELLTIRHLQVEAEMVMTHQIMEDRTEAILEVIEGSPAEGSPAEGSPAEGSPAEGSPAEGSPAEGRIDHWTQGIDPQDEDVEIMMTVAHHHHLHLDKHQHPDHQAVIPMMAGITG
jgi:hypothetical protein